jgi:hypothetical protein
MDYLSKSKDGAKPSAEHARTEMSSESAVKATAVATASGAAVTAPAVQSCAAHASTEMNAANAARAIAVATASSAEANSTLAEPSGRR